jgi:hypothetical protein
MFKTIILANRRNNSVVGASLIAEHNELTLRSIGPIVLRYEKISKTLFLQIEETTVYSAQPNMLNKTR